MFNANPSHAAVRSGRTIRRQLPDCLAGTPPGFRITPLLFINIVDSKV